MFDHVFLCYLVYNVHAYAVLSVIKFVLRHVSDRNLYNRVNPYHRPLPHNAKTRMKVAQKRNSTMFMLANKVIFPSWFLGFKQD